MTKGRRKGRQRHFSGQHARGHVGGVVVDGGTIALNSVKPWPRPCLVAARGRVSKYLRHRVR
jgi:hypothetical protein